MSTASREPMLLRPHTLVDPPGSGGASGGTEKPPEKAASFREVLACVDGSLFGESVMPHAQLVAQAMGARLTLLRVLEADPALGGTPQDPLDWGIRRREAQAHLDGLTAQVTDLKGALRSELIQGRAAEQICRWAEQHAVDLTVLCSHGAHGVTEWDLASTARKLIDRIPGSLLLVPAAAAARGGEVRYRRILVPLDGSPRAESVVPVAMRIAASQGAEVLFVHVVPIPEITRTGPLDAAGADLERRVLEHNHRIASAYLDRLRARASQSGSRVRALVVGDGSVRGQLGRLIREERADLVVMSAHGHTGRSDSPYGSVTEHAVTHATTPLLVVRDNGRHRTRRVGPLSPRPAERFASSGHAAS